MRAFRLASVLVITALGFACSDGASRGPSVTSPDPVASTASDQGATSGTTAAQRLSATVQFGNPNAGSGFPPGSGHDQSGHAADNLIPRTVVIDPGGTVTFNTFGVHQVAIYDDGVQPEDIDTSDVILTPAGCPKPGPPPGASLLIDDDTDRVALYAQPCLPPPGLRQVTHTFEEPGKYLVICAFLPHFNLQMYGWVVVRDR